MHAQSRLIITPLPQLPNFPILFNSLCLVADCAHCHAVRLVCKTYLVARRDFVSFGLVEQRQQWRHCRKRL